MFLSLNFDDILNNEEFSPNGSGPCIGSGGNWGQMYEAFLDNSTVLP